MASYRPLTDIPISLLSNSSRAATGYVIYAYLTGTTTPATLYQDAIGTSAGSSVTLDARGEPTTIKRIWLDTSVTYKLVLKTDAGFPVWTSDPVYGSLGWDADNFVVTAAGSSYPLSLEAHFGTRLTIKHFGALVDGTTDDTAAIINALSTLGANCQINFPPGTTKITSNILVINDRVNLVGSGMHATKILFAPTSDGACITLKKSPGAPINQCSIRDMLIWSDDGDYAKTALDLYDTSICLFENISIGGSISHVGGGFWSKSSDNSSIGINTHGRDTTSFRNIHCYADSPIVISPLESSGIEISADHFNFHNLYLTAASNPVITVNPGCVLTQVSFTGYQAWVYGTYGFLWYDTGAPVGASNGIYFENVRREQSTDATKWAFDIDTTSGVQSITFRGGQTGITNGFYLRNCSNVLFDSFYYTNSSLVALNADATVYPITFKNAFWQTGSTASYSGLQLIYNMPNAVSMPLPTDGLMTLSSATSYNTTINGTIGETSFTLAQDAVASIGSLTQRGFIFITSSLDVSAIYALRGPTAGTAEVSDPDGYYTTTKDNANTFNVYWNSGNNRYELQNKRAATITFKIARIGTGQGF